MRLIILRCEHAEALRAGHDCYMRSPSVLPLMTRRSRCYRLLLSSLSPTTHGMCCVLHAHVLAILAAAASEFARPSGLVVAVAVGGFSREIGAVRMS